MWTESVIKHIITDRSCWEKSSSTLSSSQLSSHTFTSPWSSSAPVQSTTKHHLCISLPVIKSIGIFSKLMLTNPRVVFTDQSRSPNIVPFHMLGIVSSCSIVTLSLRRASFPVFDIKKCRDLEIRVRGRSRSLKMVPFDRLCMISY